MRRDSRDHFDRTVQPESEYDDADRWPWWQCLLFYVLAMGAVAGGFYVGVQLLARFG